ncbi:translocase [Fuerstiella marisgermanici]|uniref:Protein translocase subunit SecA n=1 Tax=Fuerstiella marisgermanici TaxID=1891926 RepID=A0A1P8WJH4_9PLAN|nr:translocase [Fuerstiella marisgermanici]APZ94209.1 preprotein translocase subunit [Fuerstiella marisgermanici]
MIGASEVYHFSKTAGVAPAARRSRWRAMAKKVIKRSQEMNSLADDELTTAGRKLMWEAKAGTPLDKLLIEAYALVRQSARRVLNMEHFEVQIIGAIALFEGHIAEMQTGEGKTLTATMPSFLRALTGHGCHVITVNDYLAERDCKIMGPVHRKLGLTVGTILEPMEPDERRQNYACDITYATSKEMGFDFLRDRLRMGASPDDGTPSLRKFVRTLGGGEEPVQRGHYFALIDEADSILIDEARTPLIIGLTQPNDPGTVNLFRWSNRATYQLTPREDYVYEPERRSAWLTDAGCRKVVLMAKPSLMNSMDTERIYTQVEKALTAQHAFMKDRDYVIVDEKVMIVDEGTGRVMDGRKWQDGLHQAIEAKELVPITAATGEAARITVQSFFRNYTNLCGMTGTALPARRELKKTYKLKVTKIPTNKKCIRRGKPARVFKTQEAKRAAIAADIEELMQRGQSILVGTPSVEASEALAEILKGHNINAKILNARYHEQEAEIVKQAGGPGKVTIATNMAGRGTDIILDDVVKKSGGLHVIATEMHSSKRIDRQLVGRAARQGDPGSYQFYLSLEDELLSCREPKEVQRRRKMAIANKSGELSRTWHRYFKKVQRFLEKTHRKQRKSLLKQERLRLEQYENMGLDPYLELTES